MLVRKMSMRKFADIDILQYIKLNFFSKNVIHNGKGRIIPFRGAHIDLEGDSKLVIYDESLEIGLNKIKGSKAETLIRLRNNATWNVKGYCGLSYGTTIEVNSNAKLDSSFFTTNSNCVIITNKRITIGNDVMLGRNVIVFDSDFHSFNGRETVSEEVVIGDRVWITANCIILKGVHIGSGSIIAAGAVVTESVSERTVIGNAIQKKVISENASWSR